MLSQWYPTKTMYPGRLVEGMYLLSALPALAPRQLNIPPKPLVTGCKTVLDDLKTRINEHYNIGDPSRESWNKWFAQHAPTTENVQEYVLAHRYTCPLAGYFKTSVNYQPRWEIPRPVCSFSIFPPNVVLALPSIPHMSKIVYFSETVYFFSALTTKILSKQDHNESFKS